MEMQMTRVLTEHVNEPEQGLWSNCKRVGDQVLVSGLVAVDDAGDVQAVGDAGEQARLVFSQISHYVTAAGGKMDDVIRVRIYLTDMADRPAVLAARREYFTGDFPCSTLVEVSRLIDDRLLVEIDADAIIGSGVDA
jgi:2-iminobutanoate/2-iminopropanoate deaminase